MREWGALPPIPPPPYHLPMQATNWEMQWPSGLRAGLRILRSGFEPWPDHCVVFLGKTLYSHSASLHPGVSMGTSKLSGKPNEMLGGYMPWTSIPSRRSTCSNSPSRLMLQKLG